MISVRYIAPLKRLDTCASQSCYLDPYAMLSPRQGGMAYVVEAISDWKEAGMLEGDKLIVDENLHPHAGDICVFAVDESLSIRFVREQNGILWPMSNGKDEDTYELSFCGTVTRLVRDFRE